MRKLKAPISEAKYIGEEPSWDGVTPDSSRIIYAYNWYRVVLDPKMSRVILGDYMKSVGYSEADIDVLDHVEDMRFEINTLPALGRMVMRGLQPNEQQTIRLTLELEQLIKHGRKRKAEKDAARRPKPKIQATVQVDSVGDVMSKVEYSIDQGELVDVGGLLKTHTPKPADMAPEAQRYERLIEEVKHALDRTNMDCVECYRSYSKRQLRDMLARYAGVLQAINLYCSANVKAPTPRKVKPKTPTKLIAKLRYLDKHDELGIMSIDPKDIIGASEVILYNVPRRYVQRYVAPLGSKLSVRRSTIDGYDPQLSSKKKLRKPEVDLPRFLTGGNKSVSKTYEAVKAKAQEVNGMVNQQTIILRAVK